MILFMIRGTLAIGLSILATIAFDVTHTQAIVIGLASGLLTTAALK